MKRIAKASRSTTYRRRRANKAAMPPASAQEAVQTWGEWVRHNYELNRSELELVALGEISLRIANDAGARAETRLAAAARFTAITRSLNLEAAHG